MNDWITKLANEEKLTPDEEARLVAALEAQADSKLPGLVAALPRYDVPAGVVAGFEKSLAKRTRVRFASGLAACAAASLAVFMAVDNRGQTPEVVEQASADSLYDWHNEAVATSVLPGDGANLAAFSQVARNGETQ